MNMRDLFPGYYQPTKEEFDTLWKECVFSFDASVLLHIYRYSEQTRNRFFETIERLKERIWITNQVAYEFHKNRLTVIDKQKNAYQAIPKIVDEYLQLKKLKQEIVKDYKKHILIDVEDIIKPIEKAIKAIKEEVNQILQEIEQKHPNLEEKDEYQDKLFELLNGKVGNPYIDKLHIYKLAEERFKYKIPPGYEDIQGKGIPDIYGDAILWLQLIDYAKIEKKPIILVTDDNKEDWWLKKSGKKIGARPELIQEMSSNAGVRFHMYTSDRFLEYAGKFLNLAEQPEVIEEAREVSKQEIESQALITTEEQLNNIRLNELHKRKLYLQLKSQLNNLNVKENSLKGELRRLRIFPSGSGIQYLLGIDDHYQKQYKIEQELINLEISRIEIQEQITNLGYEE